MKLKPSSTTSAVLLTAGLSIVGTYSALQVIEPDQVVQPLEALGEFAEAHNYPSPYVRHPYGEGWTKEVIRDHDGKRMIFALFEAEQQAPAMQLRIHKANKPAPIVLVGPQVGWVPARGDSLDWYLIGAALDSLAISVWDTVLAGNIVIGGDSLCVRGRGVE